METLRDDKRSPMKRVILESPYAGDVKRNLEYARAAMADCLHRGEAPFASHLLYTQPGVLDDSKQWERDYGIKAGFAWRDDACKTVFYVDQGFSQGMVDAMAHVQAGGGEFEIRTLPNWNAEKPKDGLDYFIEILSVLATRGTIRYQREYTYVDEQLALHFPSCLAAYHEHCRRTDYADEVFDKNALLALLRGNERRKGYVVARHRLTCFGGRHKKKRCVVIDMIRAKRVLDVDEFPRRYEVRKLPGWCAEQTKNGLDYFIEILSALATRGSIRYQREYTYIDEQLALHVPSCLAAYHEHCKRTDYEGEVFDKTALTSLIRENERTEGYVVQRNRVCGFGGRHNKKRCLVVDMTEVKAALDVDDFPRGYEGPSEDEGGPYDGRYGD